MDRYPGVSRTILKTAAARSQMIHAVTALKDKGLTWVPSDLNLKVIRPYLNQYELCKRYHIKSFILIERPLIHPVLHYGGTPDRVGILWDGNPLPAIMDIKVTAELTPFMAIQLAAYQELIRANKIALRDEAYIIHLTRETYEFLNVWDVFDTSPEETLQGWHYCRWLFYFITKRRRGIV